MSDTPASDLSALSSMAHLDLTAIQNEIEAAQRAAQAPTTSDEAPPEARPADPREKKLYSFDIDLKIGRGQIYKGRFTNQILNIGQKMTVGVMRARLQMGVSLEAMSVETYNLLYTVTWLQHSLTEKPKWAQDLLALESEELVAAIFKHVDGHERYFRGENPDAAAGQAAV